MPSDATDIAADALSDFCGPAQPGLFRPVGVCDERSAQSDKVRLAVSKNLLCHLRRPDLSHGYDRDMHTLFDFRSKVAAPAFLETHGLEDPLHGFIDGGAHVQDIYPGIFKHACYLLRIFKGDPPFDKLVGAEPERKREIGPDLFTSALNDFQREPHAPLECTAPLVHALIGMGRHELIDEISVSAMKLDPVHPCLFRPQRCFGKPLDQVQDFLGSQRPHRLLKKPARYARRGDTLRAFDVMILSAGVVDLDENPCLVCMHRFRQFLIAGDILVLVQPELACDVLAFGILHLHVLDNDEPRTPFRPLGIIPYQSLGRLT